MIFISKRLFIPHHSKIIRRFYFLLRVLVFWGLVCVSNSWADSINLNPGSDQQYNYADSLFEAIDYPAAIVEFKRFIFFFKDDKRVIIAEYKIGQSYFYNRNYEEALDYFTQIQKKSALNEIGFKSGLMISRIYEKLNDVLSAIDTLQDMLRMTQEVNQRDKIFYQLGWLYVESGDVKQGRYFFDSITTPGQLYFKINPFSEQLDQQKNIPQKSPMIAGLLSVIPGGGYLYCGRYNDALISFVINSALIYGAYESFNEDLPVLGGIITFIELGFYAGNVYGGISSAHKYNKAEYSKFIHHIKKNYKMTFSFDKKSEKLLLGVVCRF